MSAQASEGRLSGCRSVTSRAQGRQQAGAAGQISTKSRSTCTGLKWAPVWLQAGDKQGAKDANRQALLVRSVLRAGVPAQA